MRRVLAKSVDGSRILLSDEDRNHLIRVLRLVRGDLFEAVSGDGRRFRCSLEHSPEGWHGRITGTSSFAAESPLRLRLLQALIKGDRFEWVLQKSVELGVAEIQPVETARSEVRLDSGRRGRRLERWERIMEEAVKQCGRTRIPVLHMPIPLEIALTESRETVRLALDERGEELLGVSRDLSPPAECALLIGPEGGWDPRDRELQDRMAFRRIRLGPRVLRSETAAVSALALIQFFWGDLAGDPRCFDVNYADA